MFKVAVYAGENKINTIPMKDKDLMADMIYNMEGNGLVIHVEDADGFTVYHTPEITGEG